MDLDGALIGAPGSFVRRIIEPVFGAQEIKDVPQQDELDFFDIIAGLVSDSHQVIEKILQGSIGNIVLPGGAIRKMEIADEYEHLAFLPAYRFCKLLSNLSHLSQKRINVNAIFHEGIRLNL